jgi:hypothetical protein
MQKPFSVDSGIKEVPNFCRILASIVVIAETTDEAVHYFETHCPGVLANAAVQRVTEVQHVAINWPVGSPKSPPHSL